uniref:uncharacterized protein LOC105350692 isoform X3 n=1 Tax=Fragaria vesca subsp. vesca TaxID=101020 RepID=UPI0005CB081E|nr:PREDICTED: uncharacterized protein LOC105350692 isoform X3 [Fragaria vesca subsp. vesca]
MGLLNKEFQDLAGLDNQFQTFTEVFESVVSGFERERRSERGDETILGEFRFPKDLAGLDSQFQTFTEVFESVVLWLFCKRRNIARLNHLHVTLNCHVTL